jgi:hypothetical protein
LVWGEPVSDDEVVFIQYQTTRGDKIAAIDLDDYCSHDSILFKTFKPFMHSFSRIEAKGPMTFARETFVHAADIEGWTMHMESLGLIRKPDRRPKVPLGPEQTQGDHED